jgi:hypothetical protein
VKSYISNWSTFFTILAALTGCATTQAPISINSKSNESTGVVVFAVSHDSVGGTRNNVRIFLNHGAFSGRSSGHDYESAEWPLIGFVRESDYPDVHGHLFVVTLPVGEHAFTSWSIANGSGLRILPNAPPEYRFTVRANAVTYLGAFHGNLVRGKNVFGITITGDGFVSVSDQQARDLPLLLKRFPQFDSHVTVFKLPSGPWLNLQQGKIPAVDLIAPALPKK